VLRDGNSSFDGLTGVSKTCSIFDFVTVTVLITRTSVTVVEMSKVVPSVVGAVSGGMRAQVGPSVYSDGRGTFVTVA